MNVPNFVSGKTPGFNSANFAIRDTDLRARDFSQVLYWIDR